MTHGDCCGDEVESGPLHSPDVISSFKDVTMTIRLSALLKKLLLRRNITVVRQSAPSSLCL